MLYDATAIRAVVQSLKAHYGSSDLPPLVCDPVCVSTSGHALLQEDAVEIMIEELFPMTALITPNKSEAELILSRKGLSASIGNLTDMLAAATQLFTLGPKAVLLKGGHVTTTITDVNAVVTSHPAVQVVRGGLLGENMEILQIAERDVSDIPLVVDVLHDGTQTVLYIRPRIDSTSTHGTGCTLSAAIVCALSRGVDRWYSCAESWSDELTLYFISVVESTRLATQYTHIGIETAIPIGSGHGPLNHAHSITPRLIPLCVA